MSSAAYTFVVSSLPRYSWSVDCVVGKYTAAPMCPAIPDPSVYMHRVLGSFVCSLKVSSCCSFALSLGALLILIIRFVGVHHGGFTYALISSIESVMYSG